jgi:hypothetical protein
MCQTRKRGPIAMAKYFQEGCIVCGRSTVIRKWPESFPFCSSAQVPALQVT